MQVTGCRVTSSNASARTLKRLTETIGRVRSVISGGDHMSQLASEVKSLSKVECEKLLQDTASSRDTHRTSFGSEGIPWNKLRVLRR